MSPEVSTTTPISILRASEVRQRTGLSRTTIFLKIKRGEFPAGVALGDRLAVRRDRSTGSEPNLDEPSADG
jgi:predicted DNA-binding transcriptional regulator AlpA